MRYAAAFAALLAVFAPSLSAQEAVQPLTRNAFYGELLGNGIFITVNYERRMSTQWWGRAGLSIITAEDEGDPTGDKDLTVAMPLMVNRLSHPYSNHHFESGIGVLLIAGEANGFWSDVDEDFSSVSGTATLGYRYQRPGGGFLFRAGFTPIFSGDGILPWVGVSFGGSW